MSSLDATLAERQARYGQFDEFGRLAQGIKDVLRSGRSWPECSPAQREALEMIAHKMARIVNGDPDHVDSWTDAAGYARRIELLLREGG